MHVNVASWDLKTRRTSGVEEYKFVFNAQYQKSKMKIGGRNRKKTRKNDPLTLVVDPSIRKKGSKNTCEERGIEG